MSDLHPSHEPYAADELLVRIKLTEPLFPDEEGDLWWLELSEGVESTELVGSNAVEHETSIDGLLGAVEDAIDALEGEAEELRLRPEGGYDDLDPHLRDIMSGLDYHGHELKQALEQYLEEGHPQDRELNLA